jgi:peptide/nickel transport system permease protein
MGNYLLGRLVAAVFVVFTTAVITFSILHLLPGDPIALIVGGSESSYTPQQIEALRQEYGLDEPIFVQFGIWLSKAATGDFGRSYRSNEPVLEIILPRMLPTAQLAVQASLLAVTIGILAGVTSATTPNSWKDWVATSGAIAGAAAPTFLVASLLVICFALWLRWLPASGYVSLLSDPLNSLRSTLLPSICLCIALGAVVTRQTRASLLEVLRQTYITTARAKGLDPTNVTVHHALKNGMLPVLTIMGVQLGHIFGGAVITETIFAIPGLGRLMVEAVGNREYPIVQALVLLAAVTMVAANLLVDLLYGVLDPRIRLVRGGG